ncbi:DUF6880 family protein [Phenylobacterium sp.]|uniref:DUF6880 family protein n=1 Tax=Phenylobacterium sp. TaxID=1871053 RepID=UPI0027319867|nr:DUF6880 family protein [Phenylobacterium sp.]MDP1598893.1 hypothetical protein [Phenylobacterium sp.]MDP3591424.1 hypothetical protein [Phenylobacterium sp.]
MSPALGDDFACTACRLPDYRGVGQAQASDLLPSTHLSTLEPALEFAFHEAAVREVKRAGSRKTLNTPNLIALGAERLAAVLMDVADGDPSLKRRLRMELASEVGADHLATEIAKRLTAIEDRRSRVHWRSYKAFARDLELQRSMIVGPLAEKDPALALQFLWRFLAMAEGLFSLVDDGRGQIEEAFRAGVAAAGDIAARAHPEPVAMADQVVALLAADSEQILGDLVSSLIPALDESGLAALRARLQQVLDTKPRGRPGVRAAVQALADAQGDVEGYIGAVPEAEARLPMAGAEIARRLLAAGRTEDALAALAHSAPPVGARVLPTGGEAWEEIYIAALEADAQRELAQELRWAAFETRLAVGRLRDFLRRLPDFDDVEAEERALEVAKLYPKFTEALAFLVAWPAAGAAAELVLRRASEIEPVRSEVLEPAAAMLEARHPMAASLLLRAMVADTFRRRRSERYDDAKRQLADLTSLAPLVSAWGEAETHEAFIARMERLL